MKNIKRNQFLKLQRIDGDVFYNLKENQRKNTASGTFQHTI